MPIMPPTVHRDDVDGSGPSRSPNGRPFKDALLENLARNAGLYRDALRSHLGRHIKLLG